jgi:hypothetical protein
VEGKKKKVDLLDSLIESFVENKIIFSGSINTENDRFPFDVANG